MRRHSRLLRGLAVGAIAAAVAVTSCTPTDPGDGGTIGATRARTQPDTMPLAATSAASPPSIAASFCPSATWLGLLERRR